ncbi:ester cyclase [Kitasatospora sp. NPDC056327]|uniref:ester cyclase n=1 Tax=Kitasatospora sp. NPDC056327 TaxID=3345785 RepID=UPI0035D5D89E
MTDTPGRRIRRLFEEVYNKHDFDRADEFFAPDYVNHQVGAAPGVEGLRTWATMMLTMVPDLACAVEQLVEQNDRVLVHVRWQGTIGGTDRPLDQLTANLYRLHEGRITEHWSVFDYSALAALGLTPPDQTAQATGTPDWDAGPTQQENMRLVRTVWDEVMHQHRLDRADAHYRADYIQHNAFAASSGEGLAGMKTFFAGLFALAPDLVGDLTQMIAQDDLVAVFCVWHGHEAATGAEVRLHTSDLLRIQDGLIAEHWDVMDYAAVARFGVPPTS